MWQIGFKPCGVALSLSNAVGNHGGLHNKIAAWHFLFGRMTKGRLKIQNRIFRRPLPYFNHLNKRTRWILGMAYLLENQALGFNAAASLARRVMVSQSLFLTASFGVSHEPPTHKTLGSAK